MIVKPLISILIHLDLLFMLPTSIWNTILPIYLYNTIILI